MKYECHFKILNKRDFGNGNIYQDYSATIIDSLNRHHDLSLVSGFCESVLRTNLDLINQILKKTEFILSGKEHLIETIEFKKIIEWGKINIESQIC